MNSTIIRKVQQIINSICELSVFYSYFMVQQFWNIIINPVSAFQALATSEPAYKFC